MNQLDSELIAGILCEAGYDMVEREAEADVILINTCAVRTHAEQRVFGRISSLHHLHAQKPHLILGVVGCMAQRLGDEIREKCPYVSLVAGPDAYRRLPSLILEAGDGRYIASLELDAAEHYEGIHPHRNNGLKGWISIMRGCNNFCAYCIVPYVRGRERSRPHASILAEVEQLVRQGYREITLLGQNVNAYWDGQVSFAGLLRRIDQETNIQRVRFLSSHPKDLSEDILQAMAEASSVCEHLHLALQSGSNRILKAMNRHYAAEHYLSLMERARQLIPGLSLTTDVIAGFPGEMEEDFQATLDLMQTIAFDDAFTYQYSPRRGTKAFEMPDTAPPEVKHERLCRLIALQREISQRKNAGLVGSVQEVLVEGKARRGEHQWLARTRTDKPVVIDDGADHLQLGDLVKVKIVGSTSATLMGCYES